jgi:hypothetical protein
VVRFSFFQAHPNTSKVEKSLCRLIDARKLTAEAAAHAVQNDRLPVRLVMQVLFSAGAWWVDSDTNLLVGEYSIFDFPLEVVQLLIAS